MRCNFCSKSFTDSFSCEVHERTIHHKIQIYTCKICHEKNRGIDSFDKHLTFTHGTNHWHINLGLKQIMRNMSGGFD